jgi:hypothetical protein
MAKMIIGTNLNEGVSDKSSERPKMFRRAASPISGVSSTPVTMREAMLPRGF